MTAAAMQMRFIDWIWNISGSIPLVPGQSSDDALDRLDPLFHATGTSHHRTADSVVFTKKDPAAQDKLSVFDRGVVQIEAGMAGPVLRYRLTSRALLLCFLAPLLFLGFAQLAIAVGSYQAAVEQAERAASAGTAAAKAKAAQDKAAKDRAAQDRAAKDKVIPLHPLDKALGAPEPETPKKDADTDKAESGDGDGDSDGDGKKKPSPTPAYVFAALFALLYIVGRALEDWLVKRLFRKSLHGT